MYGTQIDYMVPSRAHLLEKNPRMGQKTEKWCLSINFRLSERSNFHIFTSNRLFSLPGTLKSHFLKISPHLQCKMKEKKRKILQISHFLINLKLNNRIFSVEIENPIHLFLLSLSLSLLVTMKFDYYYVQ